MGTADHFKYRAFLSYAHEDRRWADWLHQALERYRVPAKLREQHPGLPRNLRPIFRDFAELPSGASLSDAVEAALRESEALIVICSPAAVRSQWVNEEVRRFQALGKGNRVLCFIVDGEPLSGDQRECLPQAVRDPAQHGDPTAPHAGEPIAADARGGRHERQHARLMIIAGLLQVGLDELLRRDAHRRHVRMFWVASGTTLVAVLTAGLAVYAFLKEAEAQRRLEDSEQFARYMLGDLREDLQEIGRLDILTDVNDMAMEYYRGLSEEEARDEVMAQRAEALRQIGSVRLDQGSMPPAQEAFNEALEIAQRLAGRNPDHVEWQKALARSHFYVGYVHWQRGQFDQAAEFFARQLEVVDELVSREPDNPELVAESVYAWTNYGRLLEASGQVDRAREAYRRVMEGSERLVRLEPDNPEWMIEVGFAHNNLGKLLMGQGGYPEAEAHLAEDLAIKAQALDAAPNVNYLVEYLAVSHYFLGQVLQRQGQLAEAESEFETSLALLERLLVDEPDHTGRRSRRADVLAAWAINDRLSGRPSRAEEHLTRALDDYRQLTETSPGNALWQRNRGFAHLEGAWQALARGEPAASRAHLEQARSNTETLLQGELVDIEAHKLDAWARLTEGDVASMQARDEDAAAAWRASADVLAERFSESADPEVIELSVLLARRLGQDEHRDELEAALRVLGYQSRYPRLDDATEISLAETAQN